MTFLLETDQMFQIKGYTWLYWDVWQAINYNPCLSGMIQDCIGLPHLICSLDESAPLQFGDHPADKLRVELHLIHLHLGCLQEENKDKCVHSSNNNSLYFYMAVFNISSSTTCSPLLAT